MASPIDVRWADRPLAGGDALGRDGSPYDAAMGADQPTTPLQDVRFCRSADGVRIAYARHGSGPPLVVATCWLSHLQFDWQSPVWRHFLVELGKVATVIRYDERGHGLSDPDVEDHGLEARVADLAAVVDDCGLERFALMAMAQGGPVVIDYAHRHPERVSRLLFYGSYAAAMQGAGPEELELHAAFEQMIKVGWARPDSAFRRVFTSMMIPGATEEQMIWLDELQRMSTTAATAVIARRQRAAADVCDLLPALDVPTLVLHCLRDQMSEFDHGVYLAANIRGARLVPLDSSNHIILETEPAWPVFLDEVTAFVDLDRVTDGADAAAAAARAALDELSPREVEVLRLAAEGLDNECIAEALTLSPRTVERHLQNIYVKFGVQGKSARTAAVARLLTGA
jgi:pimeloyl-ACP methyl ester carboxylesterase/DNA-binding CsgD family transcriptional regulator